MFACTSLASLFKAALDWPSQKENKNWSCWTEFLEVQPGSYTCMKHLSSPLGLLWHIRETGGTSYYGSGAFLSRDKHILLLLWAPNVQGIIVWVESSPKYILKAVIHSLIATLGMRVGLFLLGMPSQTIQDLLEQTVPASWSWERPSGQ